MSLLLDALKRAEQEKLARGTNEPAKPARPESSGFDMESPRLAPISAPVLELQPVESAAPAQPAPGSAEAKAVQNAFAAKAASAPAPRQRMALWLGLAAIVVVVAGAGGYIWYSIQQLTPPPFTPRARPRPPAAPTPPSASTEPSSAAKMEQLVALANAKPAPPVGVVTPIAADPVPAAPAAATPAAPAATPAASSAPTPQKTLESLLREAQRAAEPEPLTLQRSEDKPRVAPQVAAGYDALTLGDLERARSEYAAAASADANNIDAQLGLATVEARAGHRALAASHYRRALEIDPREPTALAGLAALSAGAAPDGLESQLRADLARGESGPLHFALGNLYASQGRWGEAQAEFFDAHRLDPANADVLFNLAVSLDHLGQARLATGYYERALDAASRQATQFDPAAVGRRLAQLRAPARP